MSDPSTARDRRSSSGTESAGNTSSDPATEQGTLERTVPELAKPIRVTGFWAAIVLPFVHVPLLFVGLSTPFRTTVFFTLLAVNLVALYVGHSHRRS
ncbi:hypothetical protein [Halopiger djelfimassiliensis]|uniref:hypothetical protein n=1 Tax=Halopiger djelfimassiliensis TaxID=1293047 RepID=UPI00067831E0|nr:hypothetical protein [Halopiger djelfimassiliensis]